MSKHLTISAAEAADRLAMRELVQAYAHCADRRDPKGQMSLFVVDTHFVVYMNAKDPKPSQELRSCDALAPVYASLAHLVEIALWAALFIICGEFIDFGTAFYHSAVNYTSLVYGDFIMTPSWRLLGPLETANGTLLFGISTAMILGVMLWLIQTRFTDLKD